MVSETQKSWIQRAGQWGLLARAGLLLALFAAFLLVSAPVALSLRGEAGLAAATLATAVCLVAGWLAMAATTWLAPPSQPAAHVLLGMILRMGLPLGLCLVILQYSAWLKDAGFGWYLVAAFSLGLAIETLLTVGQLQSHATYQSPTKHIGSRPDDSPPPPPSNPRPTGADHLSTSPGGTPRRGEDLPGNDRAFLRSV